MSCRQEAPRSAQDTLERLYLPSGSGTPWGPAGGAGGEGRGEDGLELPICHSGDLSIRGLHKVSHVDPQASQLIKVYFCKHISKNTGTSAFQSHPLYDSCLDPDPDRDIRVQSHPFHDSDLEPDWMLSSGGSAHAAINDCNQTTVWSLIILQHTKTYFFFISGFVRKQPFTEEVNTFENWLKDAAHSQLKQKLISSMAAIGGHDTKRITWNILAHIFHDDAGKQINWKGVNGKKSFNQMSSKTLILHSVRKNPISCASTDHDIYKHAIRWFNLAADRDCSGRRSGTQEVQPADQHSSF
ncbi:uncharacterized protein [Nothobranchius furzeri]|uniref:uncharacterized protein n=1 Tax=Nothobranchius furzeri TaxID=105023 RepID=UPI003904C1C0